MHRHARILRQLLQPARLPYIHDPIRVAVHSQQRRPDVCDMCQRVALRRAVFLAFLTYTWLVFWYPPATVWAMTVGSARWLVGR